MTLLRTSKEIYVQRCDHITRLIFSDFSATFTQKERGWKKGEELSEFV